MRPIGILIFLYSVTFSLGLHAQKELDTNHITLAVFEVVGSRLNPYAPGQASLRFDKQNLIGFSTTTLSDLIAENTGLFIRSYGTNGPSALSLRGTSQNHTAILWNGFNIQDPLNGGMNLCLMPLLFTDEVEITSGGVSTLYGSGAIGGILQLNNKPNFADKILVDISSGLASFSNNSQGINLQFSTKRFASSFRYLQKEGKNDFTYTNFYEFGKPLVIQAHAETNFKGFSQENYLKIGKTGSLQTFGLYQHSFREIPPTMTQSVSNQFQYDDALRFGFNYSQKTGQLDWLFKSAFLFGEMKYSNLDISIFSKHKSVSQITEVQLKRIVFNDKNNVNFGINHTFEKGISSNLIQNNFRNRMAFFTAFKSTYFRNLNLVFNLREELIEGKTTTPTFGFYSVWQHSKLLSLAFSVTKNYRVPTFNELFWKDNMASGNPLLKSETGYSTEASSEFYLKGGKQNFFRIGFFNAHIFQMIQWLPFEGVWMPFNQQKVWSRGIESKFQYIYPMKKFSLKFNFNFNYSKVTQESSEDKVLIGKQLLYLPNQSSYGSISVKFKKLECSFTQNEIGKRFVSYNQNDNLPGIWLTNFGIQYSKSLKNNNLNIGFRVINIFGIEYQVMPTYPNPGRNYEFSIKYTFKIKHLIYE